MPLGTEVGLVPYDIVLDGDPTPPRNGQSSRLFLAHVYCGHGRPSQLLLSSCLHLLFTAHFYVFKFFIFAFLILQMLGK